MSDVVAPLEATGLGKRYGRNWGLQDCSFRLPQGRIAALLGPNGAGKSTLLQIAAGITRPSAGYVEVFGHSPQEQTVQALRRIGYLDQERPLYRSFLVREMLHFGERLNPGWDAVAARDYLGELGISTEAKVGKLSVGQQAQVALTMCLAKRPPLLLLDEPVAALDPIARENLMHVLLRSVADDNTTVLLSSHAVADLANICDYVIILSSSRADCRRPRLRARQSPAPRGLDRVAARSAPRGCRHLDAKQRARDRAPRACRAASDRSSLASDRADPGRNRPGVLARGPHGRHRRHRADRRLSMIWATWRMNRSILIALFTCTAAVAAWLLISGSIESHGWTTFTSHHCPLNFPGSSEACMASLSTSQRFGQLNAALCGVLPPILGLVLGVPLVAGELEKRTNRLAWTQSITKTRWLLSKVGVGVLVVAGVIGAMAPLIWWWTDAAQRSSHIQPSNFDITGIVAVSYGVFAFMLGATLGALIRHTGWAFAAGVALYALVRLGVRLYVRPSLISPTTTSVTTPINTSYWYVNSSSTRFQPPSHFWPLQIAESVIFLGFTLALLGFAVLVVKRWRI